MINRTLQTVTVLLLLEVSTALSFDPVLLEATLPAAGASEVYPGTVLSLTFNQPVFAGPGFIELHRVSDDTLLSSMAAEAAIILDSVATVDPGFVLEMSTEYYVLVDSSAFHDGGEFYYPGIHDSTAWSFTTLGQFSDIEAGLFSRAGGSVAWGDYDNDGDLDILLIGSSIGGSHYSYIFNNDDGVFTDIGAGLLGLGGGSGSWGDYDGDYDLDLLLTGYRGSSAYTRIYRNDDSVFTDIEAGLYNVMHGKSDWGDYDNDGDLDILLNGANSAGSPFNIVYRNDEGVFTDIGAGLVGVYSGAGRWGDYDNDGDLDILLAGTTNSTHLTRIYRNDEGVFTDTGAGLVGLYSSSVAWGDYDSDGDLDILLTGDDGADQISLIYRNDAGTFIDIAAGLAGVRDGTAIWGDYDNDGDLDILLTGRELNWNLKTRIYRNDTGLFTSVDHGIPNVYASPTAWGDFDNDGDLDILLSGSTTTGYLTRIYRNNNQVANTVPTAPINLSVAAGDTGIDINWDPASDTETAVDGLSYNLQIALLNTAFLIKPGMMNPVSGYRMLAGSGNVNQVIDWSLESPFLMEPEYAQEHRTILTAIQAVDHTLAGSALTRDTLILTEQITYLLLENNPIMQPTDGLGWEIVHLFELDAFHVQIDCTEDFSLPQIDEVIDVEYRNTGREIMMYVELEDFAEFASLQEDSTYYWRVRPIYTDLRRYTVFSETPGMFILNALNSPPLPPLVGFVPANDSAVSSLTPTIAWGNGSDPDPDDHPGTLHYVIQLDTMGSFTSYLLADTTAESITHVDVSPSLFSGYRYFYRIKTFDNGDAESDWSAIQSFLTLMPPQNVTLTCDEENVTLTWEAQPCNDRTQLVYTVYSSYDSYAVFPGEWQVAAVQLTEPTWSESLTEERKFYRVTAGSIFESSDSNRQGVQTSAIKSVIQ